MKLFVTGGTGFVGTHFLLQSLAAGHEVIAQRRPGAIPRLQLATEPRWLDGPLDSDWTAELAGCDVLVHLASHTPNPPYAPLDECLYWNVFAALKLAEHARAAGVRRYLVAGSCFEYGRAAFGAEFVDASTPLLPVLSYPTSKAAATIAFEGFARQHGLLLKNLRIFQVFGEGEQASRMWPSLRKAALDGSDFPMSAGEQVRDFIDVRDAAGQILSHLDFSASVAGEPTVHPIASGEIQTLLTFARHWWARFGATGELRPGALPYRPGEIMRLVPSPDRWLPG